MRSAELLQAVELVLLRGEPAITADPCIEDAVRRRRRPRDVGVVAVSAQLSVDQSSCQIDRRTDTAGDRRSHPAQRPQCRCQRVRRFAFPGRAPRARRRRHVEKHAGVAVLRIGGQAAAQHPHRAVPVDQSVVDLHVQREAPAFEALDHMQFPRRPRQVEVVAVQPRHQHAEFAFVAGAGQRRPPHVVVEVEVLIGHPAVQRAELQPRIGELAIPRRHDFLAARLVDHLAQIVTGRVGGRGERQEPGDVHFRTRRLAVDEHQVLQSETDTVGAHGCTLAAALTFHRRFGRRR